MINVVVSMDGVISALYMVISLINYALPFEVALVYLWVLEVYVGGACVHLLAALLLSESIYILNFALL